MNPIELTSANNTCVLDRGNWVIAHRLPLKDKVKYRLPLKDKVKYAIFAARSVLDIYEREYPDDMRPREAIEAAEAYIATPSADAAAHAADTSGESYSAAYSATREALCTAAHAAAAAGGAASTAHASYIPYYTAYFSARAVSRAGYAACANTKVKILKYGIELLKEANIGGLQ
jgi:hypothetical protein